jgi:hypothetical protein
VTPKDIVLEEFNTLVASCATPHTSHWPLWSRDRRRYSWQDLGCVASPSFGILTVALDFLQQCGPCLASYSPPHLHM